MKEHLRKLKNIIAIPALLALGFLSFLGLNYKMANPLTAASIAIAVLVLAFLFLFLALKGREERKGHSKVWIIIGWCSSALYLITLLISISSVNHFISANKQKEEVQVEAINKIEAMAKVDVAFAKAVNKRCDKLKNDLMQLINSRQNQELRRLYNMHSGNYNYDWARTESNNLSKRIREYDQVEKLSFNMIERQWDGKQQTMSAVMRSEVNQWNIFTIPQTIKQLDAEIKKNIRVLQTAYALSDNYSKDKNISHNFVIDAPEKPQIDRAIFLNHFGLKQKSGLGLLIAIFLIVLASFPIIFVPLNRVRIGNKHFANIYKEGYSISTFFQSKNIIH